MVFNIKGNDHRLVVAVSYKLQIVFVKLLGKHQQPHDAIDAETLEGDRRLRKADRWTFDPSNASGFTGLP